jgi:16S rRNA processing protein RimM
VEPSDPVVIGVVVAPHGTRGTLRVRATGSGRHLREGVEPVVAGRRRRISQVRKTPRGFLVDLEAVGDRTGASALRGEELVLDRQELEAPGEGEFYVDDLIGLIAASVDGEVLGTVEETFETPAHEILVVRKEEEPDLYVPFTLEHIPEVDLVAGRVVVRPPEG